MKILVIADEIWNDQIHGNNVLTNWFKDFPAEFAMISCSPGQPYNSVCRHYFQITDRQMIRSIFSKQRAGNAFHGDFRDCLMTEKYNSTDVANIGFLRKHMGNFLRLLKTIVWNCGKINEKELEKYIKEFQPDIIFSARFAHSKILRIENIVCKYAKCPIVAFTGDNEYSLRRFSISPLFWINLFYQRSYLRKMMKNYSLYYSLSERQIQEFGRYFKTPMKILRKCAMKPIGNYEKKNSELPIQMVYGGKLYQGRDDTLVYLARVIKEINKNQILIQLHIYTNSQISKRKKNYLDDGRNSFLHEAISSQELEGIYHTSDIALCVESFDLSYRLTTRVSFSTKIIDCLASSCAVMMIGWSENSGYEYLNKQKAAICIGSRNEIGIILKRIVSNPQLLQTYKENAYHCLKNNHDREKVQNSLYDDLKAIIDSNEEKSKRWGY